jgi:hypothetical protein
MPTQTNEQLDDRLTKIEFTFAQLRWALLDANADEIGNLEAGGRNAEQVDKILHMLGRFIDPTAYASGINCPGPKCEPPDVSSPDGGGV